MKKKEYQWMQKELRIMPGEDEPNVDLVVATTVFICLPMMYVVEAVGDEEGGAEATAMTATSCSVLCNPTHMVIVQLIHVTQGLEKKKKKNCQLVT